MESAQLVLSTARTPPGHFFAVPKAQLNCTADMADIARRAAARAGAHGCWGRGRARCCGGARAIRVHWAGLLLRSRICTRPTSGLSLLLRHSLSP